MKLLESIEIKNGEKVVSSFELSDANQKFVVEARYQKRAGVKNVLIYTFADVKLKDMFLAIVAKFKAGPADKATKVAQKEMSKLTRLLRKKCSVFVFKEVR